MQRVIDLAKYFEYDESSPSMLRWVSVARSGNGRPMSIVGAQAGSRNERYFTVNVEGLKLWCHRVAYELVAGKIGDGLFVDHIDGNSFNNKICNLRLVSHKENCENRSKYLNNTSGTTGVSFCMSGSNTYCTSKWMDGGKQKHKYFSATKLGLLPAYRLAVLHRQEVIEKLNLAGASYTERHLK